MRKIICDRCGESLKAEELDPIPTIQVKCSRYDVNFEFHLSCYTQSMDDILKLFPHYIIEEQILPDLIVKEQNATSPV